MESLIDLREAFINNQGPETHVSSANDNAPEELESWFTRKPTKDVWNSSHIYFVLLKSIMKTMGLVLSLK